ncbi:TetR/AcrR family transcriptional regulator [Sphingomonas sp.]|uniref:TetR/AcrR family transcriptional regulator n=1 Tax=Sphingomonas sp. TaxID=28214 RepID=UPI003CC686E6
MSDVAFRRRPAERGEEILTAAMGLFAEKGFGATRVVDIARRAGVSHGTVGFYFATKEALLRACVDRMALAEFDDMQRLVDADQGSAAAQLQQLGRFMAEHCQSEEMSRLFRVVEGEIGNFPDFAAHFRDRVFEPMMELFRTLIRRGIARHEFACDDIETCAQLLFGSLVHLFDWNAAMGAALDRQIDQERYLRAWTRSAVAGLRP